MTRRGFKYMVSGSEGPGDRTTRAIERARLGTLDQAAVLRAWVHLVGDPNLVGSGPPWCATTLLPGAVQVA